nr:macro domain-containing protein [Schaalia odontolytica]
MTDTSRQAQWFSDNEHNWDDRAELHMAGNYCDYQRLLEDPTGRAKITGAYNLPSQRVIHTVGPAVPAGEDADMHRFELMSSYLNCLDLAQESGMGSLAFCCISTGVFGYPKQAAAEVAVDVVNRWLTATQSPMVVVFDVFSDEDAAIYRGLLGF